MSETIRWMVWGPISVDERPNLYFNATFKGGSKMAAEVMLIEISMKKIARLNLNRFCFQIIL